MKVRALCVGVAEYPGLAPTSSASVARKVAWQLTHNGGDVFLLEDPAIFDLENALRLLCDPFEVLEHHNKVWVGVLRTLSSYPTS